MHRPYPRPQPRSRPEPPTTYGLRLVWPATLLQQRHPLFPRTTVGKRLLLDGTLLPLSPEEQHRLSQLWRLTTLVNPTAEQTTCLTVHLAIHLEHPSLRLLNMMRTCLNRSDRLDLTAMTSSVNHRTKVQREMAEVFWIQ